MGTSLDLAAFRAAPLTRRPFEYLVVPGFIKAAVRAGLQMDYPQIDKPGSFPVSQLSYGRAFAAVLEELQGPEVQNAFEDKFQINLKGRPSMITVRGRCGPRDGSIHTDAETKLITALIYLNPTWEESGGRLRLLHSATNLDDVILEVPPLEGVLLAFRRSDNSFHGHKPFCGERRVIQLNWVTSRTVKHWELMRHRLSAWMKSLRPYFTGRRVSRSGKGV